MAGERKIKMIDKKVLRVTETWNNGLSGSYGYPRKKMRVVLCNPDQWGNLRERGVKLLKESEEHYNPETPLGGNSKRAKIARRFNRFAHLLGVLSGLEVEKLVD
jgi:hypothetical protein